MVSPEDDPAGGRSDIEIRNFVGLFVVCVGIIQPSGTSCTGNLTGPANPDRGVHMRFVDYRGVSALPPGQNPGSLVRIIQLVE
jgi:hypothetical protein